MSSANCYKPPKVRRESKLLRQIGSWKGSVFNYTLATAILGVWICDWKLVCEQIPFYRGKYPRGVPRKYSIEPTNY